MRVIVANCLVEVKVLLRCPSWADSLMDKTLLPFVHLLPERAVELRVIVFNTKDGGSNPPPSTNH